MFDEIRRQFIEEIGWEQPATPYVFLVSLPEGDFQLRPLAQIAGFKVFYCDSLPERKIRNDLQRALAAVEAENLCIFAGKIWQFAYKTPGKPIKCVEKSLRPEIDELLQQITLDYQDFEQGLTTSEISGKVKRGFQKNTEKVTKQFYERFKKEHARLADEIVGVDDPALRQRYAGLVLNRLMFVYFLQKKGFFFDPHGKPDHDYLKNRLNIENYFRQFLQPLFFEHLGATTSPPPAYTKIFGKVPFLNGGIFERHPVENQHPDLDVPNRALKNVFDFFDQYRWHLDDRPDKDPNQINPDVIGYIFEKYINDRAALGAYYTQEDVTEYIAKNTIIPSVFQKAGMEKLSDFHRQLVKNNPQRYLYPALKHGFNAENPIEDGLPDDVKKGLDPNQKQLYQIRAPWNQNANPDIALPNEIWRETVARRKHCRQTLETIQNDQIRHVNDLVTHNLDIQQFAQDALVYDVSVETVRKFYHALGSLTILDPTCGSGAFLFAALNILEPLYDACLNAMSRFVEDFAHRPQVPGTDPLQDFKNILQEVDKHPNPKYFVYKSIIVNNLFGVDIMDEAVDIAKLRLFLKLASVAKPRPDLPNLGIEPLPDIDFNIRTGNTLVGFDKLESVKKSLHNLALSFDVSGDDVNRQYHEIARQAQVCARYYAEFQQLQTHGHGDVKTAKNTLRNHLDTLALRLDSLLAQTAYPTHAHPEKNPDAFLKWKISHQPFHWCAEFYHIVEQNNGFDVVIGNPPYVETTKNDIPYLDKVSKNKYRDLYAYVLERALQISSKSAVLGYIIPISFATNPGFKPIYDQYSKNYLAVSFFSYSVNLFQDVTKRLSIVIANKNYNHKILTNDYIWRGESLYNMFAQHPYLIFDKKNILFDGWIVPKISSKIQQTILSKVFNAANSRTIKDAKDKKGKPIYYTRSVHYYTPFFDFIPYHKNTDGSLREPTELKVLTVSKEEYNTILCYLNSSIFWQLLVYYTDVRNLNPGFIEKIPLLPSDILDKNDSDFAILAKRLMDDYTRNKTERFKSMFVESCYSPRLSKPIIDEIDAVLAEHYGFTEEELDFIVNYDIKYRMGRGEETEA